MMRLVKYGLIFVILLPLFLIDGQDNVKLTRIDRDDDPVEQQH